MIVSIFILSFFFSCSSAKEHNNDAVNKASAQTMKTYPYVNLSKKLVQTARDKQDADDIIKELANIPLEKLEAELDNDAAKKAFFINVYNGFVQHILMKNPEKFEDRGAFFSADQITIAGKLLSLDDIEHGIIRGSKVKWSLGLIKDPFAGKFEKAFRVDDTDGRIHFALNCGAKSCPYIATFDAEIMDQQLDAIARQYLNKSSTYKPEENKVYVTSLMSWFRGDFGGKNGAKDYLRKYDVIPKDAKPDLEFKDYDWTLDLGNYTELDVKQNKAASAN